MSPNYSDNNTLEERLLWDSNYECGNPQIDLEHKKIIELINRLTELHKADKSDRSIYTIYWDLADYTRHHFKTEETLMREYAYPDITKHLREHQRLIDTLGKLIALHDKSDQGVIEQLLTTLKSWLVEHICGEDKKMCAEISKLREKSKQPH